MFRAVLFSSSGGKIVLLQHLVPSLSLKVIHPRCVVKIQVREGYPICVQLQNTTKHKTKFITLLQHYNNMFRPKF